MIIELNNLIKSRFTLHFCFVIILLLIFSFSAKSFEDSHRISILIDKGTVVYKFNDRNMELFDIISKLEDYRDKVLRDREPMSIMIEADPQVTLSSLLYVHNQLSDKVSPNIKCKVGEYDLSIKSIIIPQCPSMTLNKVPPRQNEDRQEKPKNCNIDETSVDPFFPITTIENMSEIIIINKEGKLWSHKQSQGIPQVLEYLEKSKKSEVIIRTFKDFSKKIVSEINKYNDTTGRIKGVIFKNINNNYMDIIVEISLEAEQVPDNNKKIKNDNP